LNFSGTLRDYQQEIINACADKTMGVIEAMTGSGKTATFISLVMQRKLCTLILVNTIELANQTKEAFLKFTNATPDDIGFIGSGKFKLTPICICLHQTMAKAGDEVFKLLNTYYGMVIADEIHIISARTYSETMGKTTSQIQIWI
jgi:superfamily II DNA or RNA helicase